MKIKKPLFLLTAVMAIVTALTGCETPGQSAMAGAATGAAMGGLLKGNGRNVARGAAIGAVGGYALGKYGESERQRGYIDAQGGYYAPQPPPPREVYYAAPPPPPPVYHRHHYGSLRYGRHSHAYGYVYSPYTGAMVDVRGIPHGAQVIDPSCGRTFLNP